MVKKRKKREHAKEQPERRESRKMKRQIIFLLSFSLTVTIGMGLMWLFVYMCVESSTLLTGFAALFGSILSFAATFVYGTKIVEYFDCF